MALWCYLLSHWDINNLKVNPDLTGVELERANKMLAAAKDIYRRGTAWSTVLSPNVTVEPDQEVAYPATVNGQEYLQQIFTVTSDTWVCDYTINVAFTDPSAVPAGTKIVDMNMAGVEESPQSYTRTPDADKLWQTAVLSFSAVMRLSWPTAMVSRLTGFPVFSESHLPKAAERQNASSGPRVRGFSPSIATPRMSLPFCKPL